MGFAALFLLYFTEIQDGQYSRICNSLSKYTLHRIAHRWISKSYLQQCRTPPRGGNADPSSFDRSMFSKTRGKMPNIITLQLMMPISNRLRQQKWHQKSMECSSSLVYLGVQRQASLLHYNAVLHCVNSCGRALLRRVTPTPA